VLGATLVAVSCWGRASLADSSVELPPGTLDDETAVGRLLTGSLACSLGTLLRRGSSLAFDEASPERLGSSPTAELSSEASVACHFARKLPFAVAPFGSAVVCSELSGTAVSPELAARKKPLGKPGAGLEVVPGTSIAAPVMALKRANALPNCRIAC